MNGQTETLASRPLLVCFNERGRKVGTGVTGQTIQYEHGLRCLCQTLSQSRFSNSACTSPPNFEQP